MSNQARTFEIFSGIILQKNKIAEHTYHIKIQSMDLSRIHYIPGFSIDIFLSNPYYNPLSEVRRYSFWNYEPVYHVADFAINTFSNGKGAQWVQTVQEGDTIFFKEPSSEISMNDTADHYFLIGDIIALSHLYEINRALSVSKQVSSFIYAEHQEDIFPDLDHSFPLETHIIESLDPQKIIELISLNFPEHKTNTIAYILGDSKTVSYIYNYLKDNPMYDISTIYIKSFWNKTII